jgi:hypothetical protein
VKDILAMEVILEILALAEKQGIITGGKDKRGNYAYVVIDSSTLITIIVRPGGRVTVIVDGEEQNFDSNDEEDFVNIFEAIAQALNDDNLDDKSEALIQIIEDGLSDGEEDMEEDGDDTGEDEEESEDDDSVDAEDDEESEEDEEEAKPKKKKKVSKSDEDDEEEEVEHEDELDELDTNVDEDEEDSEEEASVEVAHSDIVINKTFFGAGYNIKASYDPAINNDRDDRYNIIVAGNEFEPAIPVGYVIDTPEQFFVARREHSSEELYRGTDAKLAAEAILADIENRDDFELNVGPELTSDEIALMKEHVDGMINNMVETAKEPKAFSVGKFMAALGGSKKENETIVTGGAFVVINLGKKKPVVELHYGTINKGVKIKRKSGWESTKLLSVYIKMLKQFAKVNHNDMTRVLRLLESINEKLGKDDNKKAITNLCEELRKLVGVKGSKVKGKTYTFCMGAVDYCISYNFENEGAGYQVEVTADMCGLTRKLGKFKADYMVTMGAALAKISSMMGSMAHPDAIMIDSKKPRRFSDELMKMAVKIGYDGKSELKAKKSVDGTVRETASGGMDFWGHRFSPFKSEELKCSRCGYVAPLVKDQASLKEYMIGEAEGKEPHCGGAWHKLRYKTPGAENASVKTALTKNQVKEEIRKLGLICTITDYGEFRITFSKKELPSADRREATSYETNDPQDAIGTAKMMRDWADKNGGPK